MMEEILNLALQKEGQNLKIKEVKSLLGSKEYYLNLLKAASKEFFADATDIVLDDGRRFVLQDKVSLY